MTRVRIPALVLALVSILAGAGAAAPASAEPEPLSAQERAAIARVRALGTLGGLLPWRDFEPTEFPAVIFARGEWALAFGFDVPPEGFAPLPDVTVAGRPVARDASGGFAPPPWSPAMVAGQWAVVSELAPPAAAPAGSHLGGPASEESMARMLGDAFGLYLMRKRAAPAPQVPAPVGYPDSAELIALTSLQRRILQELFQIRQLTEVTIPNHRRLARQAIAVYEERARLIGPELAAAERDVERWDGMRADAATVLHRLAMQGSFKPEGLDAEDPGFNGKAVSGLQRALALTRPMSNTADGPVATVAQIAARFCALGFATERMDGAWRVRAVEGDRSIIDILSATLGEPREGETTSPDALLSQARQAFHYDLLLETAREVQARLSEGREALLADVSAGGAKVVIRLNGAAVTEYLEDAASARHLGGGSLLHEKGLLVRAAGLELDYLAAKGTTPLRVITRASHRADRIAEIVLVGPADRGPLGGARGAGGPGLKLEGEGLRVLIPRGSVSQGAGGETMVELPSPSSPPARW